MEEEQQFGAGLQELHPQERESVSDGAKSTTFQMWRVCFGAGTGVYARFRLQPVVGPAFMPGWPSREQPSSRSFVMSTPFTGFLASIFL